MNKNVQNLLQKYENVLVAAGAGMSAELGLRTYWTGQEATYGGTKTTHGRTDLEHLHWSSWKGKEEKQVEYFQELQKEFQTKLKSSENNHYTQLLAYLENNNKEYFVVTSNVDNAFMHYGFDLHKIVEVHGNSEYSQCLHAPSKHGVFPTPENPKAGCPKCGSMVRPNILHFDDTVFNYSRRRNQELALEGYLYNKKNLLVLEFGVGSTVPTVKHLTEAVRYSHEATVLQVNLDTSFGYSFRNPHPARREGSRKAVRASSSEFVSREMQTS